MGVSQSESGLVAPLHYVYNIQHTFYQHQPRQIIGNKLTNLSTRSWAQIKQEVIESLFVYPFVQETFPIFSSAEKKTLFF